MRLDVLHCVPLVDPKLVRGHLALVVADPRQEQTAGEVVMATGHLARLVERLQRRPRERETETKRHRETEREKERVRDILQIQNP